MCSTTPRFSYEVPETAVRTCLACRTGGRRVGVQVGYCRRGMVPGWVYRWVIPGTQPLRDHCSGSKPDSEAGPGSPCQGAGVGGQVQRASGPAPHPSGPFPAVTGCFWDLLEQDPTHGRLNLQKARLTSIFSKVSLNGQVSPKCVDKACHSPCFQNGLRKSPLGFLGFLFLPAFSHKELMGLF